MRQKARAVVCLPGLLALAACQDAERATPTARALRWLWSQQNGEGLLVSDVYGVLRRGESLTAAALLATAQLDPAEREVHAAAVQRALAALQPRRPGWTAAKTTDYACYTAALHLHALVLLLPPGWQAEAARRIAQLRTLQFCTANGWMPDDAVFGGFGLGELPPQKPNGADAATLSTTTAVLEAFSAAGVPVDDAAVVAARTFVERCQQFGAAGDDGGFCGAPGGGLLGGKGGRDDTGRARSYGTATADGVRALLACGHAPTSGRVQAAVSWLAQREGDTVPGLLPEFEPSLRFYWAAALARLDRTTGRVASVPSPALAAVRTFVLSRQRDDGWFLGLAGAMKEDDPIVATVLALQLFSVR